MHANMAFLRYGPWPGPRRQLPAQGPALPQTYSFVANSNMMGPATIKVNRNGSKELIEVTATSGDYHLRQLYDFKAHRVFWPER